IEHFSEMGRPHDLFPVFTGAGHAAWQAFRDSPKSRYAALTLPRILARPPYGKDSWPCEAFPFEEVPAEPATEDYLWMSAAWAYAARVTAAMAFDGWPARTRGADGGRVEGLPSRPLRTIEGQT